MNTNGPVPTDLVLASGPSIVTGSTMFSHSKKSNIDGRGASVFRIRVFLSGVSMVVNQLLQVTYDPEPTLGSRTRRIFHLTSSLVRSRPVWNWTPLRRLNLTCV